jgi:SAM-dependent methyltransferase
MDDTSDARDAEAALAALVAEADSGETHAGDLYGDLAPLYDAFYAEHFDYDAQADLVRAVAPAGAVRVLEGACGTGRLLARLTPTFETVVGVDLHAGMLARARANAPDATLVREDLLVYDPDAPFDVVAVLGNGLFHFAADRDLERLLAATRDLLAPGGVLVADFMDAARLVDGYASRGTAPVGPFRVDRETRSEVTDREGRFTVHFAYDVTDEESGETVRFEDTVSGRAFDPDAVAAVAREVGFRAVEVREGLDHDAVLVARL